MENHGTGQIEHMLLAALILPVMCPLVFSFLNLKVLLSVASVGGCWCELFPVTSSVFSQSRVLLNSLQDLVCASCDSEVKRYFGSQVLQFLFLHIPWIQARSPLWKQCYYIKKISLFNLPVQNKHQMVSVLKANMDIIFPKSSSCYWTSKCRHICTECSRSN